jgi:CRP-like cAMP-binding protein
MCPGRDEISLGSRAVHNLHGATLDPAILSDAFAAERRSRMASQGERGSHRQVELRAELALGRRDLYARFNSSPSRTVRPGQLLGTSAASGSAIYHIRDGWACQFRDLDDGRRAIVDMYLPGDVVGLDAVLQTRPLKEVVTLTSVTADVIHEEHALLCLMACQQIALYIAWLLGPATATRRPANHCGLAPRRTGATGNDVT